MVGPVKGIGSKVITINGDNIEIVPTNDRIIVYVTLKPYFPKEYAQIKDIPLENIAIVAPAPVLNDSSSSSLKAKLTC